jgi:uncharacterized membrane protein
VSDTLRSIDALFMLACASMYFGTGWSLVLFQLPDFKQLGPEDYQLVIVKPIERATRFFTAMTALMLLAAGLLVWGEWDTGYVWVPLVYIAATVGATALTKYWIFPINRRLEAGVTEPVALRRDLDRWAVLNRIRTLFWTVEWAAIAAYFGLRLA